MKLFETNDTSQTMNGHGKRRRRCPEIPCQDYILYTRDGSIYTFDMNVDGRK